MKRIDLNLIKIHELQISNINDILDIEQELNIHILSKENILKDLKNQHFKYFIAKYEDVVIGYTSISYIEDIEIESIVVKKDFQRLGIGNLLLNHIFCFAKLNNIQNIFLEVRSSNTPAINLYLKKGFKRINIRKNYYTDTNEDAIILKKELVL